MRDPLPMRAGQTRSASLAEATTNVFVGFVLAFLMQRGLYPVFGIITTARTDFLIAGVFTLVSLIRSYLVRRAFEHLGQR
jgi:hypothetical protein